MIQRKEEQKEYTFHVHYHQKGIAFLSIFISMSDSSTDKYKYKRFTSMTSIIEEKEKACKLSIGIDDEFVII